MTQCPPRKLSRACFRPMVSTVALDTRYAMASSNILTSQLTFVCLQNNEYSTRPQQVPSWQAWFKARYERLRFNGLRGNWAAGSQLNDLLAQLLIKNSDGSYSTTGDYQGWKYYAQMAGAPCTSVSGNSIDAFATSQSNNVSVLVGSQGYTGTMNVNLASVNSAFGSLTTLKYSLIKIPYNNGGVVTGWQTNRTSTVGVSNNQATISWVADNANDGWAVQVHN